MGSQSINATRRIRFAFSRRNEIATEIVLAPDHIVDGLEAAAILAGAEQAVSPMIQHDIQRETLGKWIMMMFNNGISDTNEIKRALKLVKGRGFSTEDVNVFWSC